MSVEVFSNMSDLNQTVGSVGSETTGSVEKEKYLSQSQSNSQSQSTNIDTDGRVEAESFSVSMGGQQIPILGKKLISIARN